MWMLVMMAAAKVDRVQLVDTKEVEYGNLKYVLK